MFTEAEIAEHRADAESLMLDTFTAFKPGGKVTGPDGMEVPGYTSQGTTRGKIAGASRQTGDTATRLVTVGSVERPVVAGGLHIPISAPVPAMGNLGVGWEYELTACGPLTDPALLNSRWLVIDAPAKSIATARRLDVVRLT